MSGRKIFSAAFASTGLPVLLLLASIPAVSCSSTRAVLVYEQAGLKRIPLKRIGHPGNLNPYHARLKSELPWIEFVDCNELYYKQSRAVTRAVEAEAKRLGETTYYGREQIRKRMVYRYPEPDKKTLYRRIFQRYNLSAFTDMIYGGSTQYYDGGRRTGQQVNYDHCLFNRANRVLLRIRVYSSGYTDQHEPFAEGLIKELKRIYNR